MIYKIIFFFVFFFLFIPQSVSASTWQYPLEKTLQREQYKKFAQYIDSAFYENTQNLYPSKFTGFHAGVDLEIFPEELNQLVPLSAISRGEIIYYGNVQGYGGLILQKLENGYTVLYGHLKLNQNLTKVGDTVKTGDAIAYLGDAASSETEGERKHLHLGLYRGTDNYFKGYEINKTALLEKWIDPLNFIAGQKNEETKPTITSAILKEKDNIIPTPSSAFKNTNILITLFNFLKRIFYNLK